MTLAEQVGHNIGEARRGKGLSQRELSLRVAIHPNDLSRLERGKHCPRVETLLRIAQALGVPLTDLLDGIG